MSTHDHEDFSRASEARTTMTTSPGPAVPSHLVCNEKTDALRQSMNVVDIEHAEVEDDPREWSRAQKLYVLVIVSAASMISGLGGNIYNPGVAQIESELHTTRAMVSLSLSLFILIQGGMPIVWSAVSEITGRKRVYLTSLTLATIGAVIAANAKSIGVLVGMRCLQAAGTAAILSIGAATLADIYDPHERGTMMGIYYCAPMTGPALGPIIGGALTQGFSWRATFYFLTIFMGSCILAFITFKDTFRRERSLTYQLVLRRLQAQQEAARKSETSTTMSHMTVVEREEDGTIQQPVHTEPKKAEGSEGDSREEKPSKVTFKDVEADAGATQVKEIRLSLKDVNPIGPMWMVLRRMNNLAILVSSGLMYGFTYSISYTCALTLGDKYHYNAMQIGLVLLSFGAGNMIGSILGGRYSDMILARLKAANGGQSEAEMRLQSTIWFLIFIPATSLAYGWVCEKHVNVAVICVILFINGFFLIAVYSSTLAYIVDANNGRSGSAVAGNSLFRGSLAFVAAEVAVPLQNSIGDGGLYTLWAGILVISNVLLLLVCWKGKDWRHQGIEKENRHRTS